MSHKLPQPPVHNGEGDDRDKPESPPMPKREAEAHEDADSASDVIIEALTAEIGRLRFELEGARE